MHGEKGVSQNNKIHEIMQIMNCNIATKPYFLHHQKVQQCNICVCTYRLLNREKYSVRSKHHIIMQNLARSELQNRQIKNGERL